MNVRVLEYVCMRSKKERKRVAPTWVSRPFCIEDDGPGGDGGGWGQPLEGDGGEGDCEGRGLSVQRWVFLKSCSHRGLWMFQLPFGMCPAKRPKDPGDFQVNPGQPERTGHRTIKSLAHRDIRLTIQQVKTRRALRTVLDHHWMKRK
jgi:hypothetical protein